MRALRGLSRERHRRGVGFIIFEVLRRQIGREMVAQPPRTRRNARAGFTLLEILVVLAILGMLIGLVAPAAMRQLGGAKIAIARQALVRLATVLDLYRLDMGAYPTAEQGLAVLLERPAGAAGWNGPYITGALPADPWGHPFEYRVPSRLAGREYDLCTGGPGGKVEEICAP